MERDSEPMVMENTVNKNFAKFFTGKIFFLNAILYIIKTCMFWKYYNTMYYIKFAYVKLLYFEKKMSVVCT